MHIIYYNFNVEKIWGLLKDGFTYSIKLALNSYLYTCKNIFKKAKNHMYFFFFFRCFALECVNHNHTGGVLNFKP